MGLLIDTNIFIDAENDRFDLNKLQSYEHYSDAYMAAVTMSELLLGVHLAKTATVRIRRSAFVEGIFNWIPVLDFNQEVARTYAELYAHFIKPRTKTTGNLHDLQIAATAITHGYAVLTHNTVDFKKIPGIVLAR